MAPPVVLLHAFLENHIMAYVYLVLGVFAGSVRRQVEDPLNMRGRGRPFQEEVFNPPGCGRAHP